MKRTHLTDLFESWTDDFLCENGIRLPMRFSGASTEYEAARTGVILAEGGDRGLIRTGGADIVDYLQRLLSSDLKKLQPGQGQWSAMLDQKGYWVADLVLYRLEDQNAAPVIFLDCPASRVDAVLERLETFHFGENATWRAVECARLIVAGPHAARQLADLFPAARLFGPAIEKCGLQSFPLPIEFGSEALPDDLRLVERPDRGLPCFEINGSAEIVRQYAEKLLSAGAVPAGFVVLEILRVESHRPRWGNDFSESSTLPGSGEWQRACFTKGCYTGQEVVAKIDTYGAAPRQLCHLSFKGPAKPLIGKELHDAEQNSVGVVTSWVWSPVRDQAVGLGIIKRRAVDAKQPLRVTSDAEEVMTTFEPPAKVRG
ncbi:MAG: aminomethyl transferase family protein [Planctomycetes bacterium]|nr:aminomethyl transferase family protein [Planctomycetota bacterium]